jgi:hypothetical protein
MKYERENKSNMNRKLYSNSKKRNNTLSYISNKNNQCCLNKSILNSPKNKVPLNLTQYVILDSRTLKNK